MLPIIISLNLYKTEPFLEDNITGQSKCGTFQKKKTIFYLVQKQQSKDDNHYKSKI